MAKTKDSEIPPETETIEGPAAPVRPPWLEDEEIIPSKAPKKKPPVNEAEYKQDVDEAKDAGVEIIKDLHHLAAERSGYAGFELTDRMGKNWRTIMRYLFRTLPVGDWPILIAALSLVVGYVMMGWNFFEWRQARKETGMAGPKRVPAGAREKTMPEPPTPNPRFGRRTKNEPAIPADAPLRNASTTGGPPLLMGGPARNK